MAAALAACGGVLVAVILLDALWTTVSLQGGGPLSRRAARGLWRVIVASAPAQSKRRQAAGAIILVATLWSWVALLWLGWGLVFSSSEGAVVDATSSTPVDLMGRVYFVGYTLVTLGNGGYVPSGGVWQILTVVASFSGLFLITLGITYLLPVVQAVVEQQQLAASVSALGSSGAAVVALAQEDGPGVSRQVERIASELTLHSERHLAYPILHYFQSGERRTAIAPNLAVLSDALLLSRAMDPSPIAAASGAAASSALEGFISVLSDGLLHPADDAPQPVPGALNGVDLARLERASAQAEPTRRRLRTLLDQNGWNWPAPDEHA